MKTVNELIKDINSLTSHLHEKDFVNVGTDAR